MVNADIEDLIYYQEMAGYMKKDCPLFEEKGEVSLF